MTPDISVILVTYNSRHVAGEVIASIKARTTGVTYEIIVVDNASADDTGAAISQAHPDVRVLHLSRNGGLSAAVNHGVAAALGAHIMQMNPDCTFEGDVLTTLSAFLGAHPDVGVAAPMLLNDDGSVQLSCRAFPGYSTALFSRYSLLTRLWSKNPVSRRYLMTDFDHASERDVDWASGAAMMFPRAEFDRVGGWDPKFFLFSEDVDFCKRVHEAGLRVVYVPTARVHHAIGISAHPSSRAVVERHRSMWLYYRKHVRRGWPTDILTAPAIAGRLGFTLAGRLLGRLRSRARRRGGDPA